MSKLTPVLRALVASPFFEEFEPSQLERLARVGMPRHYSAGAMIITENEQADWLYLLLEGRLRLSFGNPRGGEASERGYDVELRGVVEPGRVLGWSALVRPYRYRASARAVTDARLLAFSRSTLLDMCRSDPSFGAALMRRVIWVLGNRIRSTRIRLIARRYDQEVLAIRALLDQSAEDLPVTSPLHKLPVYLENRLTLTDAFDVLEMVTAHGTEPERDVAALCLEVLRRARKELEIFRSLQTIYEHIANSPADTPEEEVRNRCSAEFVRVFEKTDHLIVGIEHLPAEPGHIFILNHLRNHPENMLPNDFQLTLDTHFVSSMICFRKYGQAPVRVIRRAYRHEYGHKKYYARLGYIYVYSGHVDEEDNEPDVTRQERRQLFLDAAAQHLKAGRNIVICPEGRVGPTETSPHRFRAGAFRLARYTDPEPCLVPVAVANFDRKLTRTTLVAVIHDPFRLSDHVPPDADDDELFSFINRFNTRFRAWVEEAAKLGSRTARASEP